eukprot:COSAG01_NODE_6143_length_3826_cov_3.718809_3_plen_203_part_00
MPHTRPCLPVCLPGWEQAVAVAHKPAEAVFLISDGCCKCMDAVDATAEEGARGGSRQVQRPQPIPPPAAAALSRDGVAARRLHTLPAAASSRLPGRGGRPPQKTLLREVVSLGAGCMVGDIEYATNARCWRNSYIADGSVSGFLIEMSVFAKRVENVAVRSFIAHVLRLPRHAPVVGRFLSAEISPMMTLCSFRPKSFVKNE